MRGSALHRYIGGDELYGNVIHARPFVLKIEDRLDLLGLYGGVAGFVFDRDDGFAIGEARDVSERQSWPR